MSDLIHRKPARRMSEVPAEVQRELTAGTLETKNLVEWLVVDRFSLFKTLLFKTFDPADAISSHADGLKALQEELAPLAALKQSQRIGRFLSEHITVGDTKWKSLAAHPSDIVREWAAITVGLSESKFPRKLAWIKPFADADNAGLREIAWISLRQDVISQPVECIQALIPWTGSRNERLRRFASEITRPCGVWAPYCPTLRETPELAIELLEPLMSDDSKYVRDSVANWLNDASKTKPDWVKQTTQRWLVQSNTPETNYIVRRGLRTIVKNEPK
ncbi:MAG: DNA alkylation repair protein [Pirellula sp.]|jgi:3-methyladenine DNA glycosylase AlkC|nr:DNA alkylation repair protein [Pirellula sp.]